MLSVELLGKHTLSTATFFVGFDLVTSRCLLYTVGSSRNIYKSAIQILYNVSIL